MLNTPSHPSCPGHLTGEIMDYVLSVYCALGVAGHGGASL
jgi:hypothetical protein